MIPAISSGPALATSAAGSPTVSRNAEIDEAAKGMEGIFMSLLVNEMFKGTEITEGQPVYAGLMTEKFGDQLADSGGFGLADVIARQLGGGS
jgi:peptidoglycan hydrolase FlgJ